MNWPIARFAAVFTVLVGMAAASELYLQRCQVAQRTQSENQGGAPISAACARASYEFQGWVARAVGVVLRATGSDARVEATTVRVNAARVEVALECTGIKATAIFCGAVLAFPCSRRSRIAGILVGILGVGSLNVARVAVLAWVAGHRGAWFDPVHGVLMQGFLILFVAPLWIVWMLSACRRPGRAAATQEPAASTREASGAKPGG